MFVIFSFLSFKSLTGRYGITVHSLYGLAISKKLLLVWKLKTGESGGLAVMPNCQKSAWEVRIARRTQLQNMFVIFNILSFKRTPGMSMYYNY